MAETDQVAGLEGLPEKATCIACGYLLRGLVVARCPECGTGFDPGDAESYATMPVLGWGGTVAAVGAVFVNGILIIGGAYLGLGALYAAILGSSPGSRSLEFVGCLAMIGFGLVHFLAVGDRTERLGDRLCRAAIVVDVLTILAGAGLTVLVGGLITFFSLLLIVIPVGNILALLVIKER
jgi:hypothetical protein